MSNFSFKGNTLYRYSPSGPFRGDRLIHPPDSLKGRIQYHRTLVQEGPKSGK